MVAAWAVVDILASYAALAYNPAFLLVDVWGSIRDTTRGGNQLNLRGYTFLGLYVLWPQGFATVAAFGQGGADMEEIVGLLCLVQFMLGILVGPCAFVASLLSPAGLVPALAVGYAAAAGPLLWFIGVSVGRTWSRAW